MPTQRQIYASFTDIEALFIERVHTLVWCNAATISTRNRPRSRIWHPIWEGSAGWLLTWRNTLKTRHLEHNPYVSLAYIADIARPVYVDCSALWKDDLEDKQHVWNLFETTPEPLGYQPGSIFERVDHLDLGLLQFIPWRIEVFDSPAKSSVWLAEEQPGQ
jgi:hypothetical protein